MAEPVTAAGYRVGMEDGCIERHSFEPPCELAPEQPTTAAFEFNLSTSPVDAMFRPVTMVVGVEDDPDGGLRVYLGARYKNIYLLVDEAAKDSVRRGWGAGGHLWLWPIPPADILHREAKDA